MATDTVNHGDNEERQHLILKSTYQIERLCAALRDGIVNDDDGVAFANLAMGIVVRIADLNSVVMSAASDDDETMQSLRARVFGCF